MALIHVSHSGEGDGAAEMQIGVALIPDAVIASKSVSLRLDIVRGGKLSCMVDGSGDDEVCSVPGEVT